MFITFALVFLNFVAYFDLRTFFKQYFVQMEKKNEMFWPSPFSNLQFSAIG